MISNVRDAKRRQRKPPLRHMVLGSLLDLVVLEEEPELEVLTDAAREAALPHEVAPLAGGVETLSSDGESPPFNPSTEVQYLFGTVVDVDDPTTDEEMDALHKEIFAATADEGMVTPTTEEMDALHKQIFTATTDEGMVTPTTEGGGGVGSSG